MEQSNITYNDLEPSKSLQFNTSWINYYELNTDEVSKLQTYLNSDDFINKINKLFTNPIDNIVGILKFPIERNTSGTDDIMVANVNTGCKGSDLSKVEWFPKLMLIGKFYPNQMFQLPQDLSGCEVKLWLPYCEMINVNICDVIEYNTIDVYYTLSADNGKCVCNVVGEKDNGYQIIYQVNGQVGENVEYGGRDVSVDTKNLASAITSTAGTAVASTLVNPALLPATLGLGAIKGALSLANFMFNDSTKKYSGSSILGNFNPCYPYFILTRKKINKYYTNGDYGKEIGYACNVSKMLSGLTGYTVVSNIHLENINATAQELNEIEELLKNGVIL